MKMDMRTDPRGTAGASQSRAWPHLAWVQSLLCLLPPGPALYPSRPQPPHGRDRGTQSASLVAISRG